MNTTSEATYPIAEIFTSIQGEGLYAGVPMTFIRMAGCPVGTHYTQDAIATLGIESYQHRCVLWDDTGFPCDTNYVQKSRKTAEQILAHPDVARAHRVCITGGEPLLQDLRPLTQALLAARKRIHVETSGTQPLSRISWKHVHFGEHLYLVVSPKYGYLLETLGAASEIKILVGPDFDKERFEYEFKAFLKSGRIWLQPVNDVAHVNNANLAACLKLVQEMPTLNISVQLHKILGVR